MKRPQRDRPPLVTSQLPKIEVYVSPPGHVPVTSDLVLLGVIRLLASYVMQYDL